LGAEVQVKEVLPQLLLKVLHIQLLVEAKVVLYHKLILTEVPVVEAMLEETQVEMETQVVLIHPKEIMEEQETLELGHNLLETQVEEEELALLVHLHHQVLEEMLGAD
jgi:hypothetical protein